MWCWVVELKVGMYVRNENEIAKYLGLGKDVLTINESNQFKHYAMQHLFDNYIFAVGHDWGDTLSNEEFKNIDKYIETEPSYNSIDLIEVGDYVNGKEVTEILTDEHGNVTDIAYLEEVEGQVYSLQPIKNIVTKEQFESIKYEVEWMERLTNRCTKRYTK